MQLNLNVSLLLWVPVMPAVPTLWLPGLLAPGQLRFHTALKVRTWESKNSQSSLRWHNAPVVPRAILCQKNIFKRQLGLSLKKKKNCMWNDLEVLLFLPVPIPLDTEALYEKSGCYRRIGESVRYSSAWHYKTWFDFKSKPGLASGLVSTQSRHSKYWSSVYTE